MLRRSLSLSSIPSFSFLKSTQKIPKWIHNLSLLNPQKQHHCKNTTCYKEARVSDILEIVGPLDNLTPPKYPYFHVGLLRKCIKSNDFFTGRLVHVHLMKLGYDSDCMISNLLLDMYVKVGSLGDSIQLFDEMPERDLVSWCTLISGHVSYGFDFEALGWFKSMQEDGLKPNEFVIASILKACSGSGVVELGIQIHGSSMKNGFCFDEFVEIGMLDMYAKCGFLSEAHKLFNEMVVKNSISWNVLISGYSRNGSFREAVGLCRVMCRTGLVMDLVTMRLVMSAGTALESLDFCKNLHVYSIKIGLDVDNVVLAELLRTVAKLGDVIYMHKLFNTFRKPNAALFSIIISGCHLHGQREEALKLVEQLLVSGLGLSQGALVGILNLCLYEEEGAQIHACILKNGFEPHLSIGNALMSMYIRCGKMEDANVTFLKMSVHDLVSWTTIMAGHVQNLQYGEALELFRVFRKTGMVFDRYTVATVINACTGLQAIDQGKQIHALALKLGIEFCDFLMTSLLHMYSKCRWIEDAAVLFSSMSAPHSLVSINVMLAGYCWNLHAGKALELFGKEYQMGLVPDQFSFCTVLGACADLRSIEVGEQIHSCITKSGFGFSDIVVGNAITKLYVKCGSLDSAKRSFSILKRRDANSYAILISGYLLNKNSQEALRLFCQMHRSGVHSNPVVFAVILRGCADLAAISPGKQIHALVLKMGMILNIYIGNTMVSMYAKSSYMDEARKIFDEMLIRDDVLWNAMITGYSQVGSRDGAFELFELMKQEEVNRDYFSYVGILSACAGSAALMQGMCIHAHIVRSGLESDVSVGNSLVDMYAKCGSIRDSSKVFDTMVIRDVVSWNAMVSGYAQHGCANKALELFEQMQREGIQPDHITYIAVLSACSHVGLVDKGILHFKSMTEDHGVVAMEEHYACMVDILGRAGRLDEANGFINKMPVEPSGLMWRTLLAACKSHGNVELGAKAAWKILDGETNDSAAHVLLSNIYAMYGRWVDVEMVRNGMRGKGVKKDPGCSWIEIKDGMEVFLVGGGRSGNPSQILMQSKKPLLSFDSHSGDWG
ncbi:pentatricopeptide repeat-containing protein At4g39530-like [Magnolia sinica]|uniref:pentatricopeptide repeat-containing protein At4g39530-like n=1 Tax=Magnolia sinica TaxID=86752 RepID=UPI002658EF4F|nr:pentatricopeptide repeat-containing protein At4g39530-like [Magnolia sinica]XP_058074752.1 pentatricopeptide repeat-containing protein At4g39530-like [Magnolia sinica]XP_058074753.1 pentatricopeptide repeat-containing protein At4g39530-like [Magnolia sinica]XP_058074754.1 pentatricopeptide repeat-containing protein At4g39530-like [Magnolia sinica]XP_058074755.1 pentatricopeptide repeat-containing protein At4g39530-like [Magnolia sinica]